VGDGAFRSSTLLRLLNQGQPDQVPAQLQRWVMDNGHVVQGLVNRRNKEIALLNTPG
jgi:lysozyme